MLGALLIVAILAYYFVKLFIDAEERDDIRKHELEMAKHGYEQKIVEDKLYNKEKIWIKNS